MNTATTTAKQFLTKAEAASLVGCSVRTIDRLWQVDNAFRTRKVRGKRLIVRASFLRWLESLPE